MFLRVLIVLSLSMLSVPSLAASPERDHGIEPDDVFSLRSGGSVALSPDGGRAAYVESRWDDLSAARTQDLWVVDLKTSAATRLTFDRASESSPAWSADGRSLFFGAARTRAGHETAPWNGTNQVWRMDAAGGEATAITEAPEGVRLWKLSGDRASLLYVATRERADEDVWASTREANPDLLYGHGTGKLSELWRLDLQTWRTRKVLDDSRVIVSFDPSPDGSRVAMITTPDEELIFHEGWSRVDILDVVSGAISTLPDRLWRETAPSPYGWLEGVTWSGDGEAVAFSVDYDGYPAEILVAEVGAAGAPNVWRLTRPGTTSFAWGLQWRGENRDLCFQVMDRARMRLVCVDRVQAGSQGRTTEFTPGNVVVWSAAFTDDGSHYVVNAGSSTTFSDLHVGRSSRPGKGLRKVTDLNPQARTWKLPQIQLFSWQAADGTTVEGVLELPPDWKEGDPPLPLVLQLHGGPTWATHLGLSVGTGGRGIFASRGWALLSPNYRGSTGYGDDFLRGLIGRENDIEISDSLAGVDALIAAGLVDGERLAVMGWSNGGYMTNCIIATTERFKAASSGAGVVDQTLQWAIEDTPGHVINYMKALPWEDPEAVQKASPLFSAGAITTPTLIHVGQYDARVPPAHSRALYRALRHYVEVPVELVVYPGAGHGLSTKPHRTSKMAWDIAWFDKYVLGVEPGAEEDAEPEEAPAD